MLISRAVVCCTLLLLVYTSVSGARDELEAQDDLHDSPLNFRIPRNTNRRRNTTRPTRPQGRPGQSTANQQRTLATAGRVGAASSFFAAKLFSALFPQLTANTIISPHSVHTALAMLMLGARRTTETELLSALGLRQNNVPKAQVHRAYQALLTALSTVHDTVKVVNANGVYVKPGIPLEVAFRDGLRQNYNASFDHIQLDAPNGPEAPINAWVSNVTRGKIADLLTPGSITRDTSLVLLNAIFFNATWSKTFNSRLTTQRPFHAANDVQTVDTMQSTGIYNYSNRRGAEVIELPFTGNRISMFIILPNENSSIEALRQELSNTRRHGFNPIQTLLNNLEPTSIKLYLPKFKIESASITLKDPLQSIGIRKVFIANQVNLQGISSTPLVVSDVLHKAVIDVNENGCEAAAATAILIARFSADRPDAREVKVDRPFVYLIQDKVTKAILFMGAYLGGQA